MTDNSLLMNFSELPKPLKAELAAGASPGFSSVAIDSRAVKKGGLFVALAGEKTDGHNFIDAAFRAGASGVMAARSKAESLGLAALAKKYGGALVVVENTLLGLQDAARAYLEKFPDLVRVGITGSSGKTTTKEILAAIASTEKKAVMNSGNLNSETGLPLSVFNVRSEHEIGIFEMGMNRRGEIAELAKVLKPDAALITNIGTSHIGILGSKTAIAKEKKNIFSQFTGRETAFVPAEDEYRDFLAAGVKGHVVYYGMDYLGENISAVREKGLEGTDITWAGKTCRFALPGKANLKNACAALSLAGRLRISDEGIRSGLESVKPLFGRGEILSGKTTVLCDCYNSNFESLEYAVLLCDGLDWPGRRVYVIGSMLELGGYAEEAHRKAGRVLAASGADKVFLYGRETEAAAEVLASSARPFFHTGNMDDLEKALKDFIRSGDLVLLKGSRGCALERLIPVLTDGTFSAGVSSAAGEVLSCF